ncbi:hypothetical protein B0H13DRAFT_2130900, partial [Mycena leptocephala]
MRSTKPGCIRLINIQLVEDEYRKDGFVVWHKFTQHEDLKQELLGTGDAELVEDSAEDAFWGIGRNGQGRNELGKALAKLRNQLQAA